MKQKVIECIVINGIKQHMWYEATEKVENVLFFSVKSESYSSVIYSESMNFTAYNITTMII